MEYKDGDSGCSNERQELTISEHERIRHKVELVVREKMRSLGSRELQQVSIVGGILSVRCKGLSRHHSAEVPVPRCMSLADKGAAGGSSPDAACRTTLRVAVLQKPSKGTRSPK